MQNPKFCLCARNRIPRLRSGMQLCLGYLQLRNVIDEKVGVTEFSCLKVSEQ